MKQYTKDVVIRPANKIVINKNGFVTTNPTKEMILADGGWSIAYMTSTTQHYV